MENAMSTNNSQAYRYIKTIWHAIMCQLGKDSLLQLDTQYQATFGVSAKTVEDWRSRNAPKLRLEDIKNITFWAVTLGKFPAIWVADFLRAAGCPEREMNCILRDQFCPHNLPDPTCHTFVSRAYLEAAITQWLRTHNGTLVLCGASGTGKSSIARVLAERWCQPNLPDILSSPNLSPRIDAAVWIDVDGLKTRPKLGDILAAIARALNYQSLTVESAADRHQEAIAELLAYSRVLIIIDSLDNVEDNKLITWIENIPAPSKVLILSTNLNILPNMQKVIIEGLSLAEAQSLIDIKMDSISQNQKDRIFSRHPSYRTWLYERTGGNPKDLELLLSLMIHTRNYIDFFNEWSAGHVSGRVYDVMWKELLDEDEQQTLLAMGIFHRSCTISSLSEILGTSKEGMRNTIDRLSRLQLIDVTQSYAEYHRFTIHSSMYRFIEGKLRFNIKRKKLQQQTTEWLLQFVKDVGWSWQNPSLLDKFDDESDMLIAALAWLANENDWRNVLLLAQKIEYYYYVRGEWDRKLRIDRLRIDATRQLNLDNEYLEAISLYVQLLCRSGLTRRQDVKMYMHTIKQEIKLYPAKQHSPDLLVKMHHASVGLDAPTAHTQQ
jgi:hypothetical protein